MNILAHTPTFVPDHNSGADTMLHDILKEFIRKGHSCKVIVTNNKASEVGGIQVYEYKKQDCRPLYADADVLITHNGTTGKAVIMSEGKKIYHLIHNTNNEFKMYQRHPNVVPVYNSEWVKKELNYKTPGLVVRPLARFEDYQVERFMPDYITLVGHHPNKGGALLKELALKMPDKKFMSVKGAYDGTVIKMPDNVKVVEHGPDMKKVYRDTKILLIPSRYESWSRVASEAMCSGIPIIYNPTEGLVENVGEAGLQADRTTLSTWVEAINYIEGDYEDWSAKSLKRAKEQNLWKDYEDFVTKTTQHETCRIK